MPLIELTHVIEGSLGPVRFPGAPSSGTSEVQTLTIDATGGSFKLAWGGYTTAAISWNSTNTTLRSNVTTALEVLPSIGSGNVTVAVGTMTSGVGTLTITFAGTLAKLAVATITVANNSLTGTATLTVAETTAGVTATHRGVATGATLTDTTNGKLYINNGTPSSPTWTVVGSQS